MNSLGLFDHLDAFLLTAEYIYLAGGQTTHVYCGMTLSVGGGRIQQLTVTAVDAYLAARTKTAVVRSVHTECGAF